VPNPSTHSRTKELIALGETIRKIRTDLGMSQEALAYAAGLDVGYMGRVERGKNNVTVLSLANIADALQTTAGQLLLDSGL
jgi:transcriptional regulator with XRE-family HTH domain